MPIFERSKWIWLRDGDCSDQYAEFIDEFDYCGGEALLHLSVDNDYTVFVNGRFVTSGQYGDFEHYKIYDTVDISEHLSRGKNSLKILAYHCGVATSRYRPAAAGLLYEVTVDGEAAVYSRGEVLSRLSPTYLSGGCVFLSVQLGFTFEYDASRESVEGGYSPSVEVKKECSLYPRPIKKHVILPRVEMKSVKRYDLTHYLVDLGGEQVGLPRLVLKSDTRQKVTVAFGEHIKDGGVRKVIAYRHLYYTYNTKVGENDFTEYMLRLGCRYLEIFSEEPIELIYAGVLPQVYEVEEDPVSIENELDRRIYDACVRTLRLCMMEHYVDCPWREQALYAFDSKNQMLSGYYAFKGMNAEYARANLKLIGEDRRPDGFLSITYPCGTELAIPSFSLHFVTAVREYLDYTGDVSLVGELLPKLGSIIDEFVGRMEDGIVPCIPGEHMWNFYDWSPYADMKMGTDPEPDLYLNCLLVLALDSFEKMCSAVSAKYPYGGIREKISSSVREAFLADNSLFSGHKCKEEFTILGNSLAILAGIATPSEAKRICESIVNQELCDCSLSAKVVEYNALLLTDEEKYSPFVLGEIRKNYEMMLNTGSDTVWETLGGCDDFAGAGSLCHGWSAVPIYFFHRLGVAKGAES